MESTSTGHVLTLVEVSVGTSPFAQTVPFAHLAPAGPLHSFTLVAWDMCVFVCVTPGPGSLQTSGVCEALGNSVGHPRIMGKRQGKPRQRT